MTRTKEGPTESETVIHPRERITGVKKRRPFHDPSEGRTPFPVEDYLVPGVSGGHTATEKYVTGGGGTTWGSLRRTDPT